MVSKMNRTLITFAVFGVISACSLTAFAQKIGVVDGNKILEGYSEYAAANQKIQTIVKSWQDTMKMMTEAAQSKFDNYQKIRESMSKEALAKAQIEIDSLQRNIQTYNNQKMNQQTGDLVKVQKDLLTPILDKVKTAIGTVAKKKKVEVVFDKNAQTTYVDAAVTDLTEDVVAALKK